MNETFVGFPLCNPGLHFGEFDTTLSASASREESIPLITLTLVTDPSMSIVNSKVTLP